MTRYSPWGDLTERSHVVVSHEVLDDEDAYTVIDDADAGTARRIVLEKRLSQVERRCALAHELAHIDLKHRCHRHGPDAARQTARDEREADELAARRLISDEAMVRALRTYGEDKPGLCADDCNVTHEIWLARLEGIHHPSEKAWLKRQLEDR